ncbi:MAG TPA: hypothetical protein VFO93_19405 [Hymenobacter sp.]|uniref:hypothetical protein n=1 Tax=Hymenobacter sp. TaxID=1898978 RepID=UPI002D7EC1A8|nr:hypothetical protein [Hymenobacter sp.]HET9505721.1 hypothetical protein [Hymenobacter sp.]
MAELHIQPKKKAPSPWLLVALAALLLAAAAYFYLRPDPADEPAPAATTAAPAPADTLAPDSLAAAARATPPPGDSIETSPPLGNASPARIRLLELAPQLTQLVDRADLRDDAAIREQRDNFTSATSRLEDNDPAASLRPGLVAAASLLLAVQQKGYPNLETEANALTLQASELSGRDATPAEQTRNRAYLAQVASLLNTLSYPARDVL